MSERILVVNVNWLGDVLFSTPAIRAIRKKYPSSYIACLVPPRCENVLKNNPYLNEVIVSDDNTSIASLFKSLRLVLLLRKKKFDTAIFFHRSKTKAWIAKLAGIRSRKGFASHSARHLLTEVSPVPPTKLHKIDYFLYLMAGLGIPADGRGMDFISKAKDAAIDDDLQDHGINKGEPYVVLHAGGNWDLKRWPTEHFARWIELFTANYPYKVILCGTASEENLSKEIISSVPAGRVISLCGKTSLDALAVILKNAKFLISNDSGPIHLAASQRTPILGLFGPTSERETGPISEAAVMVLRKDVGCEIPCYFRSCNHRVCMELLSPEEVYESSVRLLKAHAS
jgi:heptosyltransferase II